MAEDRPVTPVSPPTAAPPAPTRRPATAVRRFAGHAFFVLFLKRFIPGWRGARRLAQLAFLVLFLWLIRQTEYSGQDVLAAPVNLFFRMDPLNAAAAMLAGRTFLVAFWPALLLVILTLVFGRFFCGWICPLGTLLDYFHRLLRPLTRRSNTPLERFIAPWRTARYWLLAFALLSSLMAVPVVGYLDPFGLLVRGWSVFVDPGLFHVVEAAGNHVDRFPPGMQPSLTSTQEFLRNHALPFRENVYTLYGATAGIFLTLFALEFVARRFWCRYLCPLGGMLGLAGRWSLVRRIPGRECGKCAAASKCSPRCRMDAFDGQSRVVVESCNVCMDCVADCPQGIAKFKFKKPRTPPAPVGLSRRGFITASALGVALPAVVRAAGQSITPPPPLFLRPPGVSDRKSEEAFLNLCIRCGECLKVCTTNGLNPAGLEAGWASVFAPMLIPRQGYCEVACTLCGQVCPTGAIPLLTQAAKAKAVIGVAAFDHKLCLPWAKNEECLVCEEHCPTGEKAIQFEVVKVMIDGQLTELQRPYVLQERCIGCGICENKCPLDGPAAVRVYRREHAPREPVPTTAPSTSKNPDSTH